MNVLTIAKSSLLLATGALLTACSGAPGEQLTFAEQFAEDELLFSNASGVAETLPGGLPTGNNAVYSGSAGMTIDVDGISQGANVTDPGGDFHASANLRLVIDFTQTNPTISGRMNNFVADESHSFSGGDQLLIPQSTLTGSTFDLTYGGTLNLDGSPLTVSGGATTGGAIKGTNGQLLWAQHGATTSYGGDTGSIAGGMIGQLQ